MRVKYLLYTDIATNIIRKKSLDYRCEYVDDDIEFVNALFLDLKRATGESYQLLMGTMIINYVEMYYSMLPEDEMLTTLLKQGELDEIISYLEKDVDLLLDVVQATVEKSYLDEREKENYYQMTVSSDFANIYSRLILALNLIIISIKTTFPKNLNNV